MPPATPPAPPLDPRRLLEALPSELPRPRPSIFYVVALLLVAAAMLLLPLLYLLIVTGTAIALYGYAAAGLMPTKGVAGTYFALVLYFGPLFAGFVVLLFLLKPLFAARVRHAPTRLIRREEEPHLYALAERLAHLVGTPAPSAIYASARVNASAGLHTGLVLRHRRRILLDVGLPLVAGLSFSQFAGVVSHELGHLGQGGATRLGRLIDAINGWFAHAVYERDAWDERLVEWLEGQSESALAQIPALLARAAVWMTRRVLWLLMVTGHALSCLLSREMERDADRYEARLVGGAAKAMTLQRLEVLAVASLVVEDEIETGELARLPDDLPALIAARARTLPPAAVRRVRNAAFMRETGLFDTHPSVRDRIERAHREGLGCLRIEAPASTLFRDFPGLCRRVTRDLYGPVADRDVVATSSLAAREEKPAPPAAGAEHGARMRFFQGVGTGRWRFFPDPAGEAIAFSGGASEGHTPLEALRGGLIREAPSARNAEKRWSRAIELGMLARQAKVLMEAGIPINLSYFRLQAATPDGIAAATARARRAEDESRADLRGFERIQQERLDAALRDSRGLDSAAQAAGRTKAAFAWSLASLEVLRQIDDDLAELQCELGCFDVLVAAQSNFPGNERIHPHVEESRGRLCERIELMASKLGDLPYFFPNGSGSVSLARHLIPVAPREGEGSRAARDLLSRASALHFRLLGELALAAEASEAAAGFPPLALPLDT